MGADGRASVVLFSFPRRCKVRAPCEGIRRRVQKGTCQDCGEGGFECPELSCLLFPIFLTRRSQVSAPIPVIFWKFGGHQGFARFRVCPATCLGKDERWWGECGVEMILGHTVYWGREKEGQGSSICFPFHYCGFVFPRLPHFNIF